MKTTILAAAAIAAASLSGCAFTPMTEAEMAATQARLDAADPCRKQQVYGKCAQPPFKPDGSRHDRDSFRRTDSR